MDNNNMQFMIGKLTASVDTLVNRIGNLEVSVDVLNAHMNQNKGGMRVLLALCSGSAMLGGAVVSITQWFVSRFHG